MNRDPANHPLRVFARAAALKRPVLVAGPMVRYSKLPFRETVRVLTPAHVPVLIYSPMILAREFVRNGIARASDFSTSTTDSPLVIQLGASNPTDMARAALMVQPYCDGIGLNCGCPIKDQVREGIGAALMSDPHRVVSLIRAARRACGPEFCIEAKIRIHTDIEETVRFARMLESAGVDYITVHGRRKVDRSSIPANLEAIKRIKAVVNVPVVANGDYFKPSDLDRILSATGVDGVMSARGILANPALFAGYDKVPWRAVELIVDYAAASGLPSQLLLHHLTEMMSSQLSKSERLELLNCSSFVEIVDWLDANFDLQRKYDRQFGTRDAWPRLQKLSTGHTQSLDKLSISSISQITA